MRNPAMLAHRRVERILAGARSSRRKQLEERTLSENVEILFVEVRGISKSISSFALPAPAVFKTVETTLVKQDRAVGALQALHHSGMNYD